jgi:hypothetical protein
MNAGLRDSLAQVQELFRETSGTKWAAEGARVVSDPKYKVYKGHIADCVDGDDAAFIAARHEFFRTHGPALLAMMEDHSPDAGKMGEDAARLRHILDRHLSLTPVEGGGWDIAEYSEHGIETVLFGHSDARVAIDQVMQYHGQTEDAARAGERGVPGG